MLKELQEISEKNNAVLVAVSKTKSAEHIKSIYDQGVRVFGENRAQEMAEKQPLLPEDIQWHMIGHLQKNKVKYIAPFVDMIQSVDSQKLLDRIEKEAKKVNRKISVLLQLKIAREETKYGLTIQQTHELAAILAANHYPNVVCKGLMAMATFTDDQKQIRSEFAYLKRCFDEIKSAYFEKNDRFDTLSMGMSNDYLIALEEGSTMIRIGSLIFGERS